MLQLDENFDADESKAGKQLVEDVGAEDVVARGKELLRQEIRQAEATHSERGELGAVGCPGCRRARDDRVCFPAKQVVLSGQGFL